MQATKQTKQKVNYSEGEQLLQKAVSSEKDSRRYWGQYVQWAVHKHQVPLAVITSQLVTAKGWSAQTAGKYAQCIMLLNDPGNVKHLEALINGEISFEVATMRVGLTTPSNIVYNDEETATRCLQRAFTIMLHRNKPWKQAELQAWSDSILAKFIASRP
jgi:hypothetical protein